MKEIKKSRYILKSGAITVVPCTRDDLKEMSEVTSNKNQKDLYNEILGACEAHPEEGVWHTYWKVILSLKNEEPVHVGGLYFGGPADRGTLAVSFQIFSDYKNRGYATCALRLLTEWAFAQSGIYKIEAEVEEENDAAIAVLEKNGYVMRDGNRINQSYSIEKPKPTWTGIYAVVGIILGLAFGALFGNAPIGLGIGLVGCLAFGASLDYKVNKEREEITGTKKYSRSRKKR